MSFFLRGKGKREGRKRGKGRKKKEGRKVCAFKKKLCERKWAPCMSCMICWENQKEQECTMCMHNFHVVVLLAGQTAMVGRS